jgi:hypothetical protein
VRFLPPTGTICTKFVNPVDLPLDCFPSPMLHR